MMLQTSQRAAHKGNRLRWCTAMAGVRAALGDTTGAIALLDEAEHADRRDPLPRIRPVPAIRARLACMHGDLTSATRWARSANVSADDDLSYVREFEHITLARLLIASGAQGSEPLLDRLAVAARTGGRLGSLIELLVLQALALQSRGNARAALDTLAEAIVLAEPQGYLRVFLDEGARMRELLRQATARGLAGEYTRRVLAAFDGARQPVAPPSEANAEGTTAQPLTTRELEILRLIAGGLRNQEIADTLAISAATVKRHIANAYSKLGAGHRTEALARAKDLGVL
jgi:LuxR family maltose regulon positive regulatory protein